MTVKVQNQTFWTVQMIHATCGSSIKAPLTQTCYDQT